MRKAVYVVCRAAKHFESHLPTPVLGVFFNKAEAVSAFHAALLERQKRGLQLLAHNDNSDISEGMVLLSVATLRRDLPRSPTAFEIEELRLEVWRP